MVTERAEIYIQPGKMEAFLVEFRAKALPLTETFTGCLSFKALRCEEHPDRVMFLAEWESIEAHLASRQEADPCRVSQRSPALHRRRGGNRALYAYRADYRRKPEMSDRDRIAELEKKLQYLIDRQEIYDCITSTSRGNDRFDKELIVGGLSPRCGP